MDFFLLIQKLLSGNNPSSDDADDDDEADDADDVDNDVIPI